MGREGENTTFAIENAPPNILYWWMAKRTIKMKKPIYQCLGQLSISSTTARFHFGMNGKTVFDDSYVTCCQTLKRLIWGVLAWLIMPFIKQMVSFLSYNQSKSNQKFTDYNLKYLHVISLEPIYWQSGSFGWVSTSCTQKHGFCQNCPVSALQKMTICLQTFPIFKPLKIEGCGFHRSLENLK